MLLEPRDIAPLITMRRLMLIGLSAGLGLALMIAAPVIS
jgi:hypothetical protein